MKNTCIKYLLPLLCFLYISAASWSQTTVSGVVLDETDMTLIGVNVMEKGTTNGTITDFDGNFSLSVKNKEAVLVFSYIGYQTVEMQASTSPMKIIMKEDSKALDEVVVIGYQDVRQKDLTGSVSKANVEDILKAPVASFDQALAGRIAGVNVSSGEGMPGGTMNIVIRGANSVTQDNSPLYIVDGFPVEDPTVAASINSNDIESINVLKDASAAAIYGSRGANGVIIITTKTGTVGKPTVSYDGSVGVQRITHTIPMMDAYEFVRLQSEIYTASEMSGSSGYFQTYEGKKWTLEDYRDIAQYNWQDLIFRNAMQQNHSLSVVGGTEGIRYNASMSYYDQDGIVLGSNYNRLQGRLNTTLTKNKLKINLSTNYSRSIQNGSSPSQSEYSGMNNLFYSVWGYRPVTQPDVPLETLLENAYDASVDQTNDYRFNPYMSLLNEYKKNTISYTQYNGYLEYEFIKGLKLKVSGGYTVDNRRNETFNNSKTRYGSPISTDKVNATMANSERRTWLNENVLTYQTMIKKNHSLNVLAGVTLQGSSYGYYSFKTINIPNESLGMAGMSEGTPSTTSSEETEWSMLSYLARLNYNYKSRYYLTASFRADGSSKFPQNNRFGYFPSASVAWNFTEEDFWAPASSVMNEGKIRLSWGATGNNRIDEYAYYSQIKLMQTAQGNYTNITDLAHGNYPFNNEVSSTGAVPLNLANEEVKWETTTQTNLGFDLAFLKDRIAVTIDLYDKYTTDLLLTAATPPSTGYRSTVKNIGSVRNQGLEFTLNTTNIERPHFRWTTNFNIAFNKNRVVELAEGQTALQTNAYFDQSFTSPNYIAKVGYPIGMMYGYVYLGTYKYDDCILTGYDTNNNPIYKLKDGIAPHVNDMNPQPGYARYADLNGDGIVNSEDQTFIGRGDPIHTGGFTNNFEFYGFDVSIFFQWSYGNDILNANKLMFESGYQKRKDLNKFASYIDRWTPENPNSDIPSVASYASDNVFSTRLIEDGSFLRLKTVSIGYSFSQAICTRLKINKLRIYLSGQNLYTFTKYTGYDPEVSIRNSALTPGLDFSAYPRAASINAGLNITF